jgi:hypothetical protein
MSSQLYSRDDSSAVVKPPLSQAVGYIVVVGVGLIIAFGKLLAQPINKRSTLTSKSGMVFVTRVLKKTVGENNEKTEMFMTANRSVRTGLTASAVVSVSFQFLLNATIVAYTAILVLVMEHRHARIISSGIHWRDCWPLLVRSWLQSNDCLLCSPWNKLQTKNS